MNVRTLILILIVVVMGALAALNWGTLTMAAPMSLGVVTIEAPLGLVILVLSALLGVFFLAYVLSLQGAVMLEARQHAKEIRTQRELADKAEASRFTELRTVLEAQHQRGQAALMERMDALESRLAARAQESDNVTAAFVGQLEDQLRHTSLPPK